MKLKFKKTILIPLAATLFVTSMASCNGGGGKGGDVTYDDYGIASNEEGASLITHLHYICLDKHTTYIPYSKFGNYTKDSTTPRSIDESANNSSKNVLFYTGKEVSKSTSYTREHVWACANSSSMWTHNSQDGIHYVDKSTYKGGGSDLYHVRPCDSQINTNRGNATFCEFTSGETYYTDGSPKAIKLDKLDGFANKCEPDDSFKGDVARLLMYVFVHYNRIGDNSKYSADVQSYLGNLDLRKVFAVNYSLSDIHKLIVKWDALDPVDATEKLRNDTIEKIQGNRNPFVDHPEYLKRCFAEDFE